MFQKKPPNQQVMLDLLLEIQLGQAREELEPLATDQRALPGLWLSLHPPWLWLIPALEPFRAPSKCHGKIQSFAELFIVSPVPALPQPSPPLTSRTGARQVSGAAA